MLEEEACPSDLLFCTLSEETHLRPLFSWIVIERVKYYISDGTKKNDFIFILLAQNYLIK